MATVENEAYSPKWLKCAVCGLIARDVVEMNGKPMCPTVERCVSVRSGESLGGVVWPIKKEDEQ